jgi:hypothetical protein
MEEMGLQALKLMGTQIILLISTIGLAISLMLHIVMIKV